MELYVIKRNGDYKLYESYKIKDAIEKSFNSVSIPYDKSVYETVISQLEQKEVSTLDQTFNKIKAERVPMFSFYFL